MLLKLELLLKKNKTLYYLYNFLRQLIPGSVFQLLLPARLASLRQFDKDLITERVDYYNRMQPFSAIGKNAVSLSSVPLLRGPKTYRFDAFEHTRYFNADLEANFIFGDVNYTTSRPTLQKSRPISGNSSNSILMKLNKKRHFLFVRDRKEFSSKKNTLIGRCVVTQDHRARFFEMYFGHPLCDLAQVNRSGGNAAWYKPKLSIADHLEHKFILSIEGNDVATNLKWIMSSNSVAVMPRPKYETWFMEGKLIPDFHYICIKDDYSDLEEKLNYYIENEAAAKKIIHNANAWVLQFKNKRQEDLISLLVLQKYFYYSGQINNYALQPSLKGWQTT